MHIRTGIQDPLRSRVELEIRFDVSYVRSAHEHDRDDPSGSSDLVRLTI